MSRAKATRAKSAPAKATPLEATPFLGPGPDQLALLPRPVPAPEVMAAIAAAAQLLLTRPAAAEAPNPAHDSWRFSGRWWAQPALVRRARPWARP